MKKLLIFIALMCSIASATKVNIDMSQKRSGDVWTVASYGYITDLDIPHSKAWHSNGIKVKWNIAKGRVNVECGKLCNEDEKFIVRLFDRDTLRIDFVIILPQESRTESGKEFIVPKEYRKDVAFMDIVPVGADDWRHKFSLECEDGYTPLIPTPEQDDGAWQDGFNGLLFATSACIPVDSEEDHLELWKKANEANEGIQI